MQLYLHKGKPLVKQNITDKIVGYIPVNYTELTEDPCLSVEIAKMPLSLWRTINWFFREVAVKEKSEAQVRLFYSDELKNWKAHAFPQKSKSGMTTKELNDHKDFQEQMNLLLDGGKYYQYGSSHSHVFSSAFQSSVDKNDEATTPGIHITIGKLDQKSIDLHCRFTVIVPGTFELSADGKEAKVTEAKKFYSNVNLMDFIEIPEGFFGEKLPEQYKKLIFNQLVQENTSELVDQELVELWMKNRIEEKEVSPKEFGVDEKYKYQDSYFYGGYPSYHQPAFSWNSVGQGGKTHKPQNQEGSKKNNKSNKKYLKGTTNYLLNNDSINDTIQPIVDKICFNNKITQNELCEILYREDALLTSRDVNILCEVDTNICASFGVSQLWLGKLIDGWINERAIELSVVSAS